MTKEMFFADPLGQYYKHYSSTPIPELWFREAWETNSDFREDLIIGDVDNINKTGRYGRPYLCTDLPRCLSFEQVLRLYAVLRNRTERSETEWRSDFQGVFPHCAQHLPPLDRERTIRYLTNSLLFAMHRRDNGEIRLLVLELAKWGIPLSEAKLPVREITTYFGCLATATDEQVVSAIQIADLEGLTEIAALFRTAGAIE